jgi:hypothetical protein
MGLAVTEFDQSAPQIVEAPGALGSGRNRALALDIPEPWPHRQRLALQHMRPPHLPRRACQESPVASQSIRRRQSRGSRPMCVSQENSEIVRGAAENFLSILSVLVPPSRGDLR